MRSCAIISVLTLVALVFVACSTNDGSYASLCPNFQEHSTCPVAPGALCVGNIPMGGCALDALPSGLPCSGHAQCSMSVLPCPGEVQTWAGGGRVDAYICSCIGDRWACDDCWPGESTCAEAPLADAAQESVGDAAEEVTDGPFCQQSLDAWCAMPSAGCIRDWAHAVSTPPDQGCGGWSVSVCDGYDVLSWRGTDGLADEYYDRTSGQLVSIVNSGYFQPCVGGPADFVPPSGCSPSMALCDLLADGGADAAVGAMDSGGE